MLSLKKLQYSITCLIFGSTAYQEARLQQKQNAMNMRLSASTKENALLSDKDNGESNDLRSQRQQNNPSFPAFQRRRSIQIRYRQQAAYSLATALGRKKD
jgi:hypothetical protein